MTRSVSQKPPADRSILHRVAANVWELRHAAGLTVKAAARRCKLHWRHWQKIETGELNVTILTAVHVALALEVDVETLFRRPAQSESEAALS
jgi:transcriptional regulator with XRE-family HTH domain